MQLFLNICAKPFCGISLFLMKKIAEQNNRIQQKRFVFYKLADLLVNTYAKQEEFLRF